LIAFVFRDFLTWLKNIQQKIGHFALARPTASGDTDRLWKKCERDALCG
jgi:hypothetical protein